MILGKFINDNDSYYIGWVKNSEFHGYGKLVVYKPTKESEIRSTYDYNDDDLLLTVEGLWENGEFIEDG